MLQTMEGIYKNGMIQLIELPENISESRVLITFLDQKQSLNNQTNTLSSKMIYFGMFAGEKQSTEADFREAEFHGDFDDNLEWE